MGNQSSKGDKIKIDREVYYGKAAYYDTIESKIKELTLEITNLQKQIEEMGKENMSTESEKNELKSTLFKYESQPIIKCVLKIFNEITTAEANTNKMLDNKQLDKNAAIREEINMLKTNMNNYCSTLPNNIVSNLSDMKINELRQLEEDVAQEELLTRKELAKQEFLRSTLKKLTKIRQNVSLSIAHDLKNAEEEILDITKNISEVQLNPKYEKIKGILVEQENKILTLQVHMLKSGSNTSSNLKNNAGSSSGKKNLLFCNIPEETKCQRSDYQKVQEVLKLFNGVSDDNIKVFRVGSRTPRSLKVIFSNSGTVDTILKQRHYLKHSPHSHVRIYEAK
ncbi:hypothetical protein Trydic_g18035 [Trypoxylus dichotomus]